MINITRVLTHAEYDAMQEDAISKGFYRNDRRVFTPGMAWYQPWYFDPKGEMSSLPSCRIMCKEGSPFLSVHYWQRWSKIRPPICVVCPNGETWEIDRKSSNGDGWMVEGELPNITVAPSIVVDGYHGFLRSGQFTADLDGRGPNGIIQEYR